MKLSCDSYSAEYEDGYYGELRIIELVLRRIKRKINLLYLKRFNLCKRLRLSFHPHRNHVMDWPWYNIILPGEPESFYLDFGRDNHGSLRLLLRVVVGSRRKAVVSRFYSNSQINEIIRAEFVTHLPNMKLIFAD